jgi:hypothetical protein
VPFGGPDVSFVPLVAVVMDPTKDQQVETSAPVMTLPTNASAQAEALHAIRRMVSLPIAKTAMAVAKAVTLRPKGSIIPKPYNDGNLQPNTANVCCGCSMQGTVLVMEYGHNSVIVCRCVKCSVVKDIFTYLHAGKMQNAEWLQT